MTLDDLEQLNVRYFAFNAERDGFKAKNIKIVEGVPVRSASIM